MQSAAVVEDKIFQALADPSRRAIFASLTRGEAAVKDLTARFDISQPAVSQHLAHFERRRPGERPARGALRLLPGGG
jgi:DNA-binding transcriptional ArsR family regulator